jgi:hypothetical protein
MLSRVVKNTIFPIVIGYFHRKVESNTFPDSYQISTTGHSYFNTLLWLGVQNKVINVQIMFAE